MTICNEKAVVIATTNQRITYTEKDSEIQAINNSASKKIAVLAHICELHKNYISQIETNSITTVLNLNIYPGEEIRYLDNDGNEVKGCVLSANHSIEILKGKGVSGTTSITYTTLSFEDFINFFRVLEREI